MTSAQVVETSVNVISNSPSQDYTHPDDRTLLYKIIIVLYFFQARGHSIRSKFSNLIGSLHSAEFPISAHGHDNTYVGFFPFVCHLSAKAFFKPAFY